MFSRSKPPPPAGTLPEEWPIDASDFAAYYRFSPAALALRECVRLRAVRTIDLPDPILDVGCGDGLFARLAYPGRRTWGIDINPTEVQRAQASSSYTTLICGNICGVDLPAGFFGSAIANCSLEHVPDLHGALTNIRHSLRDDGRFALIVPTPHWTRSLATAHALDILGLRGLSRAYGEALDRVFSHVHLYDEATWAKVLDRAGFEDVVCETIVTPPSSWAFDLMLYPSFLGFLTKKLTGRWVMAPTLRPLTVDTARAVVNAVGALAPKSGVPGEFLLVCRPRKGAAR